MKSILKYRLIGLSLVTMFTVFNVGLPIVVASCPMMKYSGSRSCMMCDSGSEPGKTRLTNTTDKSCCVTKYASDRNKTEFLQSTQHVLDSAKLIVAVLSNVAPLAIIDQIQFAVAANTSPPLTADIPILVSSLLI